MKLRGKIGSKVRYLRHSALGYVGLARFVFQDPRSDRNIAFMYLLSHRDEASRTQFMNSLQLDAGARRAIEARLSSRISRDALSTYPPGTLGGALDGWIRHQQVKPLLDQSPVTSSPYSYAARRLVFIHDIYHVLLSAGSQFDGEALVAGFTCAQIEGYAPAYVQFAAGLLRCAFFDPPGLAVLARAFVRGWELGKRAESLFGIDWDARLAQPIEQVRAQLGLAEAGVC